MSTGAWTRSDLQDRSYAQADVTVSMDRLSECEDLKLIVKDVAAHEKAARLLHVGHGCSSLPEHLYDEGYTSIVSIDSQSTARVDRGLRRGADRLEAIPLMRARNRERLGMTWLEMDATDMAFTDGSFDVVVDNGMLDRLICAGTSPMLAGAYLGETVRVLAAGGAFVCASLHPPEITMMWLEPHQFSITVVTIAASLAGNRGTHAYVCSKGECNLDAQHQSLCLRREARSGAMSCEMVCQSGTSNHSP
ncbi:unnamed protein product [Prorocentrum cordatum]|uniref:Methyltransferase type 11 domain-containing protein n=1 Tax=Prorocentrum cordatum TaxID=2364126 RepID=A0ABN9RVI0_9DINO|nr:unnamed protein product [Polarella glacialis]